MEQGGIFDQIKKETNAALACPVLVMSVLPASITSTLIPVFPSPWHVRRSLSAMVAILFEMREGGEGV